MVRIIDIEAYVDLQRKPESSGHGVFALSLR